MAARNGYTNVFVMAEGIKGWVTAGKKYDTGGA